MNPHHEISDDACGDAYLSQARDIHPIPPLGPRALAKVERPSVGPNGQVDPSADPEFERHSIPGTGNVLIKLPTGRTFQLPGNPTHVEIVAACYAFAAGLAEGKRIGGHAVLNIYENAADKAREELQ